MFAEWLRDAFDGVAKVKSTNDADAGWEFPHHR
jgi:hypothetical protein